MMTRLRVLVCSSLVTISALTACEASVVKATAERYGVTLTDEQAHAVATHLSRSPLRPGLNWAALRRCESGGNYRAVNPSGKYRGAYQFDQRTWDGNAPAEWRGVRPDQAPPLVQDRAAQTLFDRRGRSPWPICGKRL